MSLTFRSRNEGFAARLYRSLRWAGAYAPLLALFLMVLVVSGVSRTLLVAWQLDRVSATEVWPTIFLHGLRVDAILAGLVVAVPLLLAPLLAHRYSWRFWKQFTVVWAVAMVFMVLFIELATPTFIAQYDVRPNRLFIEYLKYPREVLATLWNGFRIPDIAGPSCWRLPSPCWRPGYSTPGGRKPAYPAIATLSLSGPWSCLPFSWQYAQRQTTGRQTPRCLP